MKRFPVILAPIGIIPIIERNDEDTLLLSNLKDGVVGTHAYCNGYVILVEGIVSKIEGVSGSVLKCAACNMALARFPAKIKTYGGMRRHFEQIVERYS